MTTASHRWNPADYAQHSKGQERWARELLGLVHLQSGESVLDIGCGDGRITADISAITPKGRVVGIDRSAEMITFARRSFPSQQFSNLSFLQVDASALPFSGEFDVVFSNAVLHWILDHRPVLSGIARALRPGGRCVLQMGGKGNGVRVVHAVEDALRSGPWQVEPPSTSPYGFHAPEDYRRWLDEDGLVPDSVELIRKDMVHATGAAFTGWLRTAWLPYTELVPEPERDRFLVAATKRYLEEFPPDEAGQVHVEMMRLQVQAHKKHSSP